MCREESAVDKQISVRVSASIARALERQARKAGLRVSDLVRMAIDQHLVERGHPVSRADRVKELLGSLHSGLPDLGKRHREYILESIDRGR